MSRGGVVQQMTIEFANVTIEHEGEDTNYWRHWCNWASSTARLPT